MIVSAGEPDYRQITQEVSTIRITEVAALDYPEDGYEYRGLIRSCDEADNVLMEQILQTRRKPEWLINVRHQGRATLHVALQFRPLATQHWFEIEDVALPAQVGSDGPTSTDLYVPLRGWAEAPRVQLRVRLSKSQTDDVSQQPGHVMASIGRPAQPVAPYDFSPTTPAPDEAYLTPDDLRATPSLTAPEQVIVKDVWNKFLAVQDMLVELFFERLLHVEPDLADCLGDAVDTAAGHVAEMIDVGVRQLNPRTERILREAYRGIYPDPTEGHRIRTVADYAALLANLGVRPKHWMTARRVWLWTLQQIPHLEEYDLENLSKGTQSAPYRFFTIHILGPALAAARQYNDALTPDVIGAMRRTGELLAADARAIGTDFYRILFLTYPELIPYFGRTDVDSLAEHLMQSVAFLVRSLESGRDIILELRELSRTHANIGIPPDAYAKIVGPMLTVMKQRNPDFTPAEGHAWTLLLDRVNTVLVQPIVNRQRILKQAKEFIDLIAGELAWEPADHERRWHEIEREVRATGTYTHTYEELAYGAQLAWRNSAKCIGRISWRNMIVRDLRHVTDPDEMFRECAEHLRMGTNGGNMQTVMSVFRPKKPQERWGPRIWNGQYIRFAAYEQADGTILGDKANLKLTQALIRQGWTPPAVPTAFDCLPLAIDVPGHAPRLYEFAPEDVRMVPIEHPAYPAFSALNLRWCAIPAIANFRMEIGGVQYGCVPFNGWFMETEIARNLWEEGRYARAGAIAQAFGLDTSSEQTLWRDRAFLELNAAVLHSFSKARVTLVDHQTAARQFLTHDQREKRAGRECPAQWSWVVPSAGGSSTPVWHHEMRDFFLSPNFHYAADKWAVVDAGSPLTEAKTESVWADANRVLILFGSETGTAESYARQTARRLNRYQPRVMALDDYDVSQLGQEQFVLVIVSTFGEGDLPGNAKKFLARVQAQPNGVFNRLNFSVMALGSTVYPHFCAAGTIIDRQLARLGGNRVVTMHRGDEIKGQADTFRQWLELVARLLGEDPTSVDLSGTSQVRLQVSFMDAAQVPSTAPANRRQRLPGIDVPIVANRELLKEVIVGSRSTRFIAFDVSATDLSYETGDHVAIYPHNPAALVHRLCDRLGVDADAWFATSLVNPQGAAVSGDHPYPEPVSVRDVLTEDLDLTLREPFDELINALLRTAEAEPDRERLETWVETLAHGGDDAACLALTKHIADSFPTVADLLDAFPSARLSFTQLIDLLPKQKPRLYSISSCPLVYPNQIHITVGVVEITTDAGKTRPGLCSNYLAGLDPKQNATARIAVRTSSFRPPSDPHAPMLMVGPGTGLSPLVGFLQHREVQFRALKQAHAGANGQTTNGKALNGRPYRQLGYTRLFFGCRNLNDYLYQQELESWRETGVLTQLDVAFSRLGEDKVYVQHLIGRYSRDLWQVLSQPDCHYYVCGDAKMADDVFAVLLTIAKTEGGLSHAEAVSFFRTMQNENRFVMDVWGVLLNFREALAEVQEAKYAQGERWFEQLRTEGAPS